MASSIDPTTLGERLLGLLSIYTLLTIAGIIGFSFLRTRLPWFYYPRKLNENGVVIENEPAESAPLIAKTPYSSSRWGWMKYVWRANEDDEMEEGSFVGVAYLTLMRHSWFFITWLMAISIGLILPLNIYGGHDTNGVPDNKGFIRTTLSNIVEDSESYMWGHVIVQFAQAFVLIGVMGAYFRRIFDIDTEFQSKGRVEFHTVKLRHLPSTMTEKKLMDKLEKYFPGQVLSVHFAHELNHILSLKKKYQQFLEKFEDAEYYQSKGKTKYVKIEDKQKKKNKKKDRDSDEEGLREDTGLRKPTTKEVSRFAFWKGKKVAAIPYYEEHLRWLRYQIEKYQMQHLNNPAPHTGIAFVTFQDASTALAFSDKDTILKKVKQLDGRPYGSSLPDIAIDSISTTSSKNEPLLNRLKGASIAVSGMNRKMAVSPAEILWENLGATRREQTARATITMTVTVIMALLWAIPIALLSSFSALAQIPVIGPLFQRILTNHPSEAAFVQSILSPLLAIISEQLVRGILTKLSALEKPHSRAGLEASFQKKYFIFILFNVFLFQTVFVSGLDALAKFSKEDGTVLEAVSSINWTYSGAFFINYLMQKTFIGFLFSLFRVTTVFVAIIKRWRAGTARQIRKAAQLSYFRYSVYFGKVAIYIGIAMMYSTVVPLVTGAAFLLFSMRYWSDKYNILLSLPKYDSTAIRCVRLGFYFVIVSALMSQLFLLNYFAVLEPKSGYVLIIPVIAFIACFIILNKLFAWQKKRSRPKHLLNYETKEDLPNAYLHPGLMPLNVELHTGVEFE
eukprot:TRINITY_DN474_c0_g7_i1.p1 TRINITY_DN474_c0_g7~~TRINITY_DN474_c0_g7_i1.p1  ORF type:complete len:790 (-),score=167.88 TRINITY_DN474_c0_g7_i1:34-2403(-)